MSRPHPAFSLLCALGLLCVPVVGVTVQTVQQNLDPRIVRAEELHYELRAAESLAVYEWIVEREPKNYEALWKTARETVVMGLLAHGSETENRWFMKAEEYARRATEVEPDGIDGLQWLVSSKGLRAVQTNALDASRLGTEVYRSAHRILEMDSLYAGAHHSLGVLNYEVQKLTRFERLIATRILGNRAFRLTSWEDAERYLKRAVALEPDFLLYHLDLGKMYLERKQMTSARQAFQRVLELPSIHPPDKGFQEVAERLLARTY
jgi:tetratricopeptide (TPR) repeat protein